MGDTELIVHVFEAAVSDYESGRMNWNQGRIRI